MSLWTRAFGSMGKATVTAPRSLTFTLRRLDPFGAALHGDLYCEGQHVAVTLENAEKAIPAGRYQIVLTESGRALEGGLWTPRDDHKLPLLVDVPGRTAIRLHAANLPRELEGCIAPGMTRNGEAIESSRDALITVMSQIDAALALGEAVWIDVQAA